MAQVRVLPRQVTGPELFMRGLEPGLQAALKLYLDKKMGEAGEQREAEQEKRQEEYLGLAKQREARIAGEAKEGRAERHRFLESIGAFKKAQPRTPIWHKEAERIKKETGAVVTPSSGPLPLEKPTIDPSVLQKYPGLSVPIAPGFTYRVPVPRAVRGLRPSAIDQFEAELTAGELKRPPQVSLEDWDALSEEGKRILMERFAVE